MIKIIDILFLYSILLYLNALNGEWLEGHILYLILTKVFSKSKAKAEDLVEGALGPAWPARRPDMKI